MINNPIEWFSNKIVNLGKVSKKQELLEDIKSLILNSDRSVLNEIIRAVSVQPIFECLNTTDAQETESACTIIYELLTQLPEIDLLKTYGDSIQISLAHSSDEVKRTSLKLLEKIINENTIEYLITKQPSILIDAAGCLALEERSCAQGAISLFVKIGSYPMGINVVYSEPVRKKFKEIMLVNDISRFRVYEIVAAISKISPENLAAAVSNGLMGHLVSEIFSSDILLQLNVLEILSTLATSNHGLSYLFECNIIQELINKLLKVNEEPLSFVLLPGLIEFFGNLCVQQPENFAKEYPEIMLLLFNSIETADETLLGVIITTVGKIGSSCSGRLVLTQYKEQMNIFFKKMTVILSIKNDLTISALNTLGELLRNINGDHMCNEITEKWMDAMGQNIFNSIVDLARLPFIDFRLSALSFFKAISSQKWGAIKLSNYPGMVEFLLDRSSEFTKDCKQIKYEIIFNIIHCPEIEHFLNPENLSNLREFVKEGPFFVPVETEMATEGTL